MSRWLAVVIVAACGGREPPRIHNAAPPFALWPAPEVNPVPPLVADAFDGAPPILPLLAADGSFAIVDLSVGISVSDAVTFEVGVVMDARVVERVAIVDRDMALRRDRGDAHRRDPAVVARRARLVDRRVAGATPFASAFDPTGGHSLELQTIPVGDGAHLRVEELRAEGREYLGITLLDAAGRPIARREVNGTHADGDAACPVGPRLSGVWVDARRKRVLTRTSFHSMRCACGDAAPAYQLFALP